MKIKITNRADFVGWGWRPPRRRPRTLRSGIDAALRANPALARASKSVLVPELMARFAVGRATAYRAIDDARNAGKPVGSAPRGVLL